MRIANIRLTEDALAYWHCIAGIFYRRGDKYELHVYRAVCRRHTLHRMDKLPFRRMKAHNEGKAGAKYTRAKRPVKLVYYEGFATKEEAMIREYRIKQLTREKKLELMKF